MSLFVRNFSGTFENLQSTCPEEIFEEFFFLLEEKVFLERFWTLSDKLSEPERKLKSAFQRNNDVWEFVFTISIGNWGFCKKITVIVQSFFLRVYRNSLMKKNWFEKSIFSLNFFGFRANTLRPFVDKFSAGGQNCFLQVRRKILRKKINFLEKKYIFYCLFWTMTEEFWPSDYKTFGRYVKTAFYVSFGTFWGLIIDSEKKCSLANLSGNNIVYCRICYWLDGDVSEANEPDSQWQIRNILYYFRKLGKQFSSFWLKMFSGTFKITFCLSTGTF